MNNLRTTESIAHFIQEYVKTHYPSDRITPLPDPVWQAIRDIGTELWLDTGDIEEARKLYTREFSALTTNNTLLNAEVQKGQYDSLVPAAAEVIQKALPGISRQELLLEVAFVLNAVHGLRLTRLFDAYVSVELHTDLAHDVERSVAYGKRYFALCPERFIIKVPLTPAGYLAARKLIHEGIPVNFTLGFSVRQNYLAALLAKPTYVNVFMGRLNAYLADNHFGSGENAGEKVTLATQRTLQVLRAQGRTSTKLIGASMRNGAQVGKLAGLDVFTMPPKVAAQYHAQPDPLVKNHVSDDPDIPMAAGVTPESTNLKSLWDLPVAFTKVVEHLLHHPVESLTPEEIVEHFEEAEIGDFLPRWSDSDIETATKDGKIPVYEHWKDRLARGEIGLDALMNLSALCSFTSDQKALDDRVAGILGV